MTFFISSKTKHAPKWRAFRELGAPIVSTWIDEAEPGQTADMTDLAKRCIREASLCHRLIAYREPGEELKGALIEIGAALAFRREVVAVGDWNGWQSAFAHHPCWRAAPTVEAALALVRVCDTCGGVGTHTSDCRYFYGSLAGWTASVAKESKVSTD